MRGRASDVAWRRWRIGAAFIAALLFAVLASHRLHDNDLYWHLAFGRGVIETHRLTIPEPLAFADFGTTVLAHQWLWDVIAYSVQSKLGYAGLSELILLFAAISGMSFVLLVSGWTELRRPRIEHVAALTLLTCPLILTRLNERPETMTAVLWPLGLILARRLATEERTGWVVAKAIGIAAIALVWSQTHLSLAAFVASVFIVVAPGCFGNGTPQRVRIGALVAVFASMFVTPFGAISAGALSAFLRNPISGYLSDHIGEWKPLRWEMLDPTDAQNVQGPIYALLFIVALVGAFHLGRRRLVEIALATLGFLIVLKGRRGTFAAAFLTAPLVIVTLEHLLAGQATRLRIARAIAVLLGIMAFVRMTTWTEHNDGSLTRIGLDEGAFPVGAVRWLDANTQGEHRALTTYRTGPTLGFETKGRIRGYVDSRTPQLFSEAHFAAYRAVLQDQNASGALAVATQAYGFEIAVVERVYPVCTALSKSPAWTPVLIEPAFTTFVRSDLLPPSTSITRLAPCGSFYLDEAASCAPPLLDLDIDLDRIARYTSPSFMKYLKADQKLRCARKTFDGDVVAKLIPAKHDALGFEPARDSLEAWLFALAGRPRQAIDLLEPHVRAGETWTLADSLMTLNRGGASDEAFRRLLQLVVDNERDNAPEAIVVSLANTCARLGDVACAWIYGAREAALGKVEVAPALCYVSKRAPTPEARADADRWMAALRKDKAMPQLTCENLPAPL